MNGHVSIRKRPLCCWWLRFMTTQWAQTEVCCCVYEPERNHCQTIKGERYNHSFQGSLHEAFPGFDLRFDARTRGKINDTQQEEVRTLRWMEKKWQNRSRLSLWGFMPRLETEIKHAQDQIKSRAAGWKTDHYIKTTRVNQRQPERKVTKHKTWQVLVKVKV